MTPTFHPLASTPVYNSHWLRDANSGYTVEKQIAYSYLPATHARVGGNGEVEYFGEPYPASVVAESLLDPDGARLKR